MIEFQITSVDRENRTALTQIETRTIAGDVPGATLGGTRLLVHDPYGAWLNDASRTYTGVAGGAVYLDPGGTTEVGNEYGLPRFSIWWLGCDLAECFQ